MKMKVCAAVALALVASHAISARADVQLGEHATLSGFGTFGAVKTDTDQAEFGKDRQPGGATRNPDALVDSNLGVQLTVKANSWLSATVQVLAQRRDHEAMDIEPEWAFIRVQPMDDLTLRVGRMTLPAFLISDFRNVGYANTWLRAPNEVYALSVFRRLDGADLTYRKAIGSSTVTASVLYGDSDLLTAGMRPGVDDVRGGSLSWEYDGLTVRASRTLADVLFAGIDDGYIFNAFGATWDRDNLIVQAEYVQRRATLLGDIVASDGHYLMAGYRLGNVTPYATFARTKPEYRQSPIHVSFDQETKALGLRWDAFSSAAIKVQVESIDTQGTPGISFNAPVSGTVHAISASIDFTF